MTEQKHTPIQKWLETATKDELLDGVQYLLEDARYLEDQVKKYNNLGLGWLAQRVQASRLHSLDYANAALKKAKGE